MTAAVEAAARAGFEDPDAGAAGTWADDRGYWIATATRMLAAAKPIIAAGFARPFRINLPDGREIDGVEFPSGRVVLDDIRTGLIGGYISIEHVAVGPDDQIEWADKPTPTT